MLNRRWPLHLLGLSALAVAQPLLDLLGANPEFFIAHHTGRVGILLVLAALLLGVPVILIGLVWTAGVAGRRLRRAALATVVAGLAGVFVMPLLKRAGVHTSALAIPAALAGCCVTVLYARSAAARSFVTIVSLAAMVAIPGTFLARSGIRTIVFADELRGAIAELDPSKPTVVLFVFDEVPLVSLLDENRQIDPVLYPNLAALAADGAWFRNATASAEFTPWAMPAILDGRYPRANSIPTPADHPQTLFTLLGRSYRIEAFEAVTNLCPDVLCPRAQEPIGPRVAAMADDVGIVLLAIVLPEDLTRNLPDLSAGWAHFGASETTRDNETPATLTEFLAHWRKYEGQDTAQLAREFIDGIGADDGRPTFYFMHTLVSHHPYRRLPDGRTSATRVSIPGERKGGIWGDNEWEVIQNYQRHLMEIGFVDALVGRAVERLKDAGLYDEALVMITADHGIAFAPGSPLRNLRPETAPEIVPVPLIVKWPEGATAVRSVPRGIVERNAEAIDIAPTIADVAGIAPTWQMDGSSLADPSLRERSRKVVHVDNARSTRIFGPTGPGYAAALDRKLQQFGSHGNMYRVPRPAKYAGLVNTPVASHTIQDDEDITILNSLLYHKVDPEAATIPFDVVGIVENPKPESRPVYVALAVNGTIRAVTRTWEGSPARFDATPDPTVWRADGNTLAAFVISGSEAAPVLHGGRVPLEAPPDLNLIDPEAWPFGVKLRGFYHPDGSGEEAFRWTRGRASVTVPLDPDRSPRAVRVDVRRTVGRHLSIRANGCRLFDGDLLSHSWSATLSLGACEPPGGAITILFDSPVSRSRSDARTLGVAVRSVVLVY